MQLVWGVLTVLGLFSLAAPVVADTYTPHTDTYDYLVKFRSGYSEEDVQSFFHQLTRYCEIHECSAEVKQRFHRLLQGAVLSLSPEKHVQRWIRERAEVDKFEVDSKITLAVESMKNTITQSTSFWHLDRIDQQENAELDGSYSFTYTGKGITVYVVDSGIRPTHDEFDEERVLLKDFVGDGYNDCNGHGTHVAGTVGGRVAGVAKEVNLVAVRIFGCEGEASTTTLVTALEWAWEDFLDSGASTAVINLSLSASATPILDDVIEALNKTGLVVVSAAGNSDADACLFSPARSSSSITVGATVEGDARANFSNTGSCVDIFAPGDKIWSAWPTSDSAGAKLSGTSMAAPIVSGLVARYLEKRSDSMPDEVASSLLCGATVGVVSNLPRDNELTPNLLAYGDPKSIERIGIDESCPAGKDAVCAGTGATACSSAGNCLNSGRCICDCGHLGQACQFAADIEELGSLDESPLQVKSSTQSSPPLFVGSAGSKVFALDARGDDETISISTCSSTTNFPTWIGLVDGCFNNLLFDGAIRFPSSTSHPDCEVSSGASYLETQVTSGNRYHILVLGEVEGNFELFVHSIEESTPTATVSPSTSPSVLYSKEGATPTATISPSKSPCVSHANEEAAPRTTVTSSASPSESGAVNTIPLSLSSVAASLFVCIVALLSELLCSGIPEQCFQGV
eukprot:gb/GECG01003158.1/.p1 GENE.gb/GECG01003158.1/~~gb/GECG01003158.1/.p1  ORF type:complete len:684 (+),score=79.07 gb/GECG01003158.1/:1-2052(+)